MQTLKIEIPEGHEIDTFDKQSGVVRFKQKPKDVTERIKSVSDLLADHGFSHAEFDRSCAGLSEDEKAYRLIKMLGVSLNEGWEPDWDDDNQRKYFTWFEMGGSSGFRFDDCPYWRSSSGVGSRLCFKTSQLAEHAGKHFTEVYKKFMLIP